MNKSSLFILFMLTIVIIVLGFIAYKLLYTTSPLFPGNSKPTPVISVLPSSQPTPKGINRIFSEKGEEIQILTPSDFTKIQSPLIIEGEAKGTWFFEGSFPIEIISSDGKSIVQVPATAVEDWMTSDWVSFRTTITFDVLIETPSQIIFRKDNPSGLPENDDFATIETILSAEKSPNADNTMSVKVFFSNDNFDPNIDSCEITYEVSRTIPETQAVAKAALEELLKGPNTNESAQGYSTSIPSDAKLKSVNLKEGVLTADFETLGSGIGGSCLVGAIRSQIENTLKQFPTVQEVKICEMGECEMTLQP